MGKRSGQRQDDAQQATAASEHCGEREYDHFLSRLNVTPQYRRMRARWRREFVEHFPTMQEWFDLQLHERIGRLSGERQGHVSFPVAYRAHSYLFYLCLTDRLRLDYPFLLAIGDLRVEDVAGPLRVECGIRALRVEGEQLGYSALGIKTSAQWVIHRVALHTGIRRPNDIRPARRNPSVRK